MSFGTVLLKDRTWKRIDDRDTAVKLYKVWKGLEPGDEQQQAYIGHVRSVTLPPKWRDGLDYVPVAEKPSEPLRLVHRTIADENNKASQPPLRLTGADYDKRNGEK